MTAENGGRRSRGPKHLTFGELTLDLKDRLVSGDIGQHRLTPTECDLLATFMQHPRQVLSRRFLMHEVWLTDFHEDTRVLEVYVSILRRKIEPDPARPCRLVTVRGVGYRLE